MSSRLPCKHEIEKRAKQPPFKRPQFNRPLVMGVTPPCFECIKEAGRKIAERIMASMKWYRVRFRSSAEDFRPVKWPPPGPYWCSGHCPGPDEYSVLVAYVKDEKQVTEFWPEATDIEVSGPEPIVFSGRFPRPDWWE